MSAERLARLRRIFEAVVDLPESAREAVLAEECAGDPALADAVRAMVASESGRDSVAAARPFEAALELVRTADRGRWLGRKVGRFELVGELGRGGMGQVFRARRIEDGVEHWAAVKLMRDDVGSGSLLHRFANERQILARLNHPGIAHFIEAGTEGEGLVYVAMELVDGEPLLDHVRRLGLGLDERLKLFRQLLAAVAYAHRNLVIHRDIKAANVLVRADGVVKLLDFGIAKPIDPSMTRTGTADRVFTPLSAAPEQLRGDAVDVTTDVYALGVLLYELVCGVPPFDVAGLEPGAFERLVLTVPPPRMQDRARRAGTALARIPADLEQIVQQALRKEQAQRYASVDLFDLDVQRFLADEPVSASGATTGYRLRKFLARHAWASGFAALSVVAVLTALGLTVAQNRMIRAERDRANASLAVLRDAFVAADPTGETQGKVSAREILEGSGRVIAPLAEDQPALFADIATTIAGVQMAMGLWADAGALAERAAEAGGRDSGTLLLMRARAAIERGDATKAESLLDALPPSAHSGADYWLIRARIAVKRSLWPEAERAARQSLASMNGFDARFATAMAMVAEAVSGQGRSAEADQLLAAAITEVEATLGGGHSLAGLLEYRRLALQLDAGSAPEATQVDALVDRFRDRFGARSASFADVLHLAADHHRRGGDPARAASLYSEAASVFGRALGREHPSAYRADFNAAQMAHQADPESGKRAFQAFMARVENLADVPPEQMAFFRFQAGKAMARPGRTDLSRDALAVLAAPIAGFDFATLADKDRQQYAAWLAFAFWSSGCTPRPAVDSSIAAVCTVSGRLPEPCGAARERACVLSGLDGPPAIL